MRNDVSRAVTDQCRESDRRWTLLELQVATGIEKRNIHKILREDLDLHGSGCHVHSLKSKTGQDML